MARQLRGRSLIGNMKRAAWWYYYMGGSGGGGAVPADLVWNDDIAAFTGLQSRAGVLAGGHNVYTPRMMWYNGKTYFSYHGIYTDDGFGQGYVIVYDENNGVGRPFRITSTEPSADSHTTPSFSIDDDGNLFMFQERVHGSPIDIYKGADWNFFSLLAEKIGPANTLGYMNIMKDEDGNGISWCRWSTDPNRNQAVVRASNGFESWGTPRRLTTNVAGDTGHYLSVPLYRQKVGNYWYVMTVKRGDELVFFSGWWSIYWVYKTTDFIVFENLVGTPFSHDTTGDNYMTETILNTNFQVHDSGNIENNDYIPYSAVSPEGVFFMVVGDGGTGDLVLHVVADRVNTKKALNISDYVVSDPALSQANAVKSLAYIDNYLELIILIDEGTYEKPHLFRSYDLGDTWTDLGDMIPEVDADFQGVCLPFNYHEIPNNRNFSIAFLRNDAVTSGTREVYVKRAAKGTIQTETPVAVSAVAITSDAYNVVHYIAQEASITHTGTNLTAITDQFGVRNGTGVNNPQWDGTEIVFNGTNNYINVAVASLSLTKLTLIAVVRTVGGADDLIISFTDNTSTTRFLAFAAKGGTYPAKTLRDDVGKNLQEFGQDTASDNAYHILTFVSDGRCKEDIYIDGKKQFYQSAGYVDTTDYAKRGTLSFGAAINSIRIASRDSSGTDVFRAMGLKEIMVKNNVYDYETQRGMEKTIADRHGITLDYGYE